MGGVPRQRCVRIHPPPRFVVDTPRGVLAAAGGGKIWINSSLYFFLHSPLVTLATRASRRQPRTRPRRGTALMTGRPSPGSRPAAVLSLPPSRATTTPSLCHLRESECANDCIGAAGVDVFFFFFWEVGRQTQGAYSEAGSLPRFAFGVTLLEIRSSKALYSAISPAVPAHNTARSGVYCRSRTQLITHSCASWLPCLWRRSPRRRARAASLPGRTGAGR